MRFHFTTCLKSRTATATADIQSFFDGSFLDENHLDDREITVNPERSQQALFLGGGNIEFVGIG